MNYENTGDERWLSRTMEGSNAGVLGSHFGSHAKMFEEADRFMENYAAGHITAAEAASGIRSLIADLDYLPSYYNWHRKEVRSTPAYTVPDMTKMYLWFAFFAPKEVRKDLMGSKLSGVFSYTWKNLKQHRARVSSRRSYLRDIFTTKSV